MKVRLRQITGDPRLGGCIEGTSDAMPEPGIEFTVRAQTDDGRAYDAHTAIAEWVIPLGDRFRFMTAEGVWEVDVLGPSGKHEVEDRVDLVRGLVNHLKTFVASFGGRFQGGQKGKAALEERADAWLQARGAYGIIPDFRLEGGMVMLDGFMLSDGSYLEVE